MQPGLRGRNATNQGITFAPCFASIWVKKIFGHLEKIVKEQDVLPFEETIRKSHPPDQIIPCQRCPSTLFVLYLSKPVHNPLWLRKGLHLC